MVSSKKIIMCVLIIKMQDSLFSVTKHNSNLDFTNMALAVVLVFAVRLQFFMLCHSSCHYTIPQIFRGAERLEDSPPYRCVLHKERKLLLLLRLSAGKSPVVYSERPLNTMQILQNLLLFKQLDESVWKERTAPYSVQNGDWRHYTYSNYLINS